MHPTLIHIGSIPIRSFGLMVLLGFILALIYAMSAARRKLQGTGGRRQDAGSALRTPISELTTDSQPSTLNSQPVNHQPITPDHVFDMSLAALFVSIAGARILYVLLDLNEFRGNWWEVFQVWTGGISVHGAIVSGSLFLWWYCRRHKLSFLKFADICAPAFALGYAVGRIGCFLNGCCYGYACSLPWASRFLINERTHSLTPPSHPTQLYATVMNLGVFLLLDRLSRLRHRDGQIFLLYLALYCVYRFIDEHFRKGATAEVFVAGLTHAQVFSLAALPVILHFLYRTRLGTANLIQAESSKFNESSQKMS